MAWYRRTRPSIPSAWSIPTRTLSNPGKQEYDALAYLPVGPPSRHTAESIDGTLRQAAAEFDIQIVHLQSEREDNELFVHCSVRTEARDNMVRRLQSVDTRVRLDESTLDEDV
jgi:hypothetical protein